MKGGGVRYIGVSVMTGDADGACDGFTIVPSLFPDEFEAFVDLVVPELQRRGIYRTAYEGRTLRDRLGLREPVSRYAAKGAAVPRRSGRH